MNCKEWQSAINEFLRNYKYGNWCPMLCLHKQLIVPVFAPKISFIFSWKYLCLSTNDRGKMLVHISIPKFQKWLIRNITFSYIRNIVKTFLSGKSEKMVQKCLSDLGLSGDKVIFRLFRNNCSCYIMWHMVIVWQTQC